jgi:hypothetical protein
VELQEHYVDAYHPLSPGRCRARTCSSPGRGCCSTCARAAVVRRRPRRGEGSGRPTAALAVACQHAAHSSSADHERERERKGRQRGVRLALGAGGKRETDRERQRETGGERERERGRETYASRLSASLERMTTPVYSRTISPVAKLPRVACQLKRRLELSVEVSVA